MDKEFFTIVFEGDIAKLDFNPMNTNTIYGKPVAAGVGNCFSEMEDLIEDLNEPDKYHKKHVENMIKLYGRDYDFKDTV